MSLEEKVAALESLVSQMDSLRSEIVDGRPVYTTHTNVLVDFVLAMVDLTKQLYDEFKAKKGTTLPDVEYWIGLAENRASLLRRTKFGDLVLTRDHNLVIDALKPLELALKKMEEMA